MNMFTKSLSLSLNYSNNAFGLISRGSQLKNSSFPCGQSSSLFPIQIECGAEAKTQVLPFISVGVLLFWLQPCEMQVVLKKKKHTTFGGEVEPNPTFWLSLMSHCGGQADDQTGQIPPWSRLKCHWNWAPSRWSWFNPLGCVLAWFIACIMPLQLGLSCSECWKIWFVSDGLRESWVKRHREWMRERERWYWEIGESTK